MNKVNFTRGINGKPAASQALEETLATIEGLSGECFFGYPLIPTPEGKYFIDATLVSREKGVVLFDLVEGTDVGDYAARQDDLANKIEAKLKLHKELVKGRRLIRKRQTQPTLAQYPSLRDNLPQKISSMRRIFSYDQSRTGSAMGNPNSRIQDEWAKRQRMVRRP